MSRKSDAAAFARELRRSGWTVRLTNSAHWRAVGPHDEGPVAWGSTPSDHRWRSNARAEVRRAERTRKNEAAS